MAKAKAKTKRKSGAGRRKTSARSTRSTGPASKIARLDSELVRLLQQRASLSLEFARQNGQLALVPPPTALSEETLRLADESQGPMPARRVRTVLREVADGCRAIVRAPRIAFAGPPHGLGHLAAIQYLGTSAECVPVDGAAAVFEEVRRKQSDFGLVSLDGSVGCRVSEALDQLVQNGLRICGKVSLDIHFSLLGKCPRADVREVYGQRQALSQCRNWLAGHLPSARTVEVTSTSTACQLAGEKSGAAALAGRFSGVCFNLELLAEDIENVPAGAARFAVIGERVPPRTGDDRTAILLQVAHRPGALADALAVFKRNKINLTWLESLPFTAADQAVSFFVEIEGHEADKLLRRRLTSLRRKTLRVEALGAFPAAAAVD